MSVDRKEFSPLHFLAAMGAGGIAVAPFAIMQYTIPHPKGLITQTQMANVVDNSHHFLSQWIGVFEGVMIVFAIIHLILSALFYSKYFKAKANNAYDAMEKNPLTNATLLGPFLAIAMTFNVFIGVVRYFVPWMQENFQALMLPSLIAWLALLIANLFRVMQLLRFNFTHEFDLSKAHFGWMLFPFSLGMTSVVGSGIAALAKNPQIANIAAFGTSVGLMGASFLLIGKLITLFQVHYEKPGLPDRTFLPSLLAVVPILTVLGIASYRLAHYAEVQLGFHMNWVGPVIVGLTFAFQTFYLLFGLVILKSYLFNEFRKSDYYPSQWALVCPFIAWGVLGAFVSFSLSTAPYFVYALLTSVSIGIGLFGIIFYRMLRCSGIFASNKQPQTCA
jgi:hypothetical protein